MRWVRFAAAVWIALLLASAPGAPQPHPVTLHFRQGVGGYNGFLDRAIGGNTGVAFVATASPGHYWLRYGPPDTNLDQRFSYLVWFDLSVIPAKARVLSASLDLKAGDVYSPGDVHVRKILDPDSLGSSWPSGWATVGASNVVQFRVGANAVFRNQAGQNEGVRWSNSDAADEHSHIENALAPDESGSTVRWQAGHRFYTHTVTEAVQDWVNGTSPNQGWLVYAAGAANIQENFTGQDPNPDARPRLNVTFLPPAGMDTTVPGDVTDLTVNECGLEFCTLSWTAPGADGNNGRAAAYDLRYSIAPITEDNWDSATQVLGVPRPQPAGSRETLTVNNLSQAIHYYFAVRALDNVFNFSGLSNVADGATASSVFVTYHPRVIINRDLNLEPLKDIARGPLSADFNELRGYLDSGLGWKFDDYDENSLLSLVYAFSYMYLMTGDNRYADKVIDDYLVRGKWLIDGTDNDNIAFGLECAAIAYDWTYARIAERDAGADPGLKTRIVDRIRQQYAATTDDVVLFRETIRESDFHNFVTEYINAWLTAGLALYGDHPDSIAMIKRGWGMLADGFRFQPTAFDETFTYNLKASIDLTGGAMNWEGEGYWRNAVPEILRAIEAIDTASNRTADLWNNVFPNTINAGYYKLYSMRADKTTPGLGDSNAGAEFSWKDNFGLVILLGRFKDGHIRQLIDTNGGQFWGANRVGSVFKLLFYDPSVAPLDFGDLPTSRRFGRDIIMRSGWGPSDTFLTFSAGFSGVFHNHLDDNSFTVFKYSDLATDGGYSLSSPYYGNYFKRTIAHNAITILDPSDCWRDGTKDCTLSNDGGQRWPYRRYDPPFSSFEYGINRLWSATVLDDPMYREQFLTADVQFETAAGYDYINSDATRAYSNRWSGQGDNTGKRATKVVREFLYLKPDTVLILDRVSSANPALRKTWLLHSLNAPSAPAQSDWIAPQAGITDIFSPTFRIDNGKGRLFARTLLPRDARARVIGGAGYEGWVNGQNYWAKDVPASAGKWRVEVQPGAAQRDDLFLHALYVTGADTTAMPAVTPIDGGSASGALIQAPSGPVIGLFSLSDAPLRRAAYSVAWPGTVLHVIAGMAPGRYDVIVNGGLVATVSASQQGVVSFTAPGGDVQVAPTGN